MYEKLTFNYLLFCVKPVVIELKKGDNLSMIEYYLIRDCNFAHDFYQTPKQQLYFNSKENSSLDDDNIFIYLSILGNNKIIRIKHTSRFDYNKYDVVKSIVITRAMKLNEIEYD